MGSAKSPFRLAPLLVLAFVASQFQVVVPAIAQVAVVEIIIRTTVQLVAGIPQVVLRGGDPVVLQRYLHRIGVVSPSHCHAS